MKKIFFYLALSLFAFSCSDDDGDNGSTDDENCDIIVRGRGKTGTDCPDNCTYTVSTLTREQADSDVDIPSTDLIEFVVSQETFDFYSDEDTTRCWDPSLELK